MASFGLRLAGILALGFQLAQSPTEVSSQSQKHLREVADALPADSTLRQALQNGAHGDGTHYSWMDEMKRGGVKCAKVEIHLTWFFGPRFLKIARIMYFTSYDDPDSQVTNPERIKFFQTSGLEAKLKEVALKRGRRGFWFESPPHQHPSRWWPVPAAVRIDLLDDEFLPVFPPHYWDFDSSQTQLVRAVAAGDRFETQKILSQGNLDSRDLGQALVWAGAERNTNTVLALLSAGANVNAQDHKGNTALMAAAAGKNVRVVKVLLDAGADRTIKNKNGETALSIASNANYAEVVQLLSY
jgi:hypothetical protein